MMNTEELLAIYVKTYKHHGNHFSYNDDHDIYMKNDKFS